MENKIFIFLKDGRPVSLDPKGPVKAYVLNEFGKVLCICHGDREIFIEPADGITFAIKNKTTLDVWN